MYLARTALIGDTFQIFPDLYNEVLVITNDILQPGQSYNKMYGTEPRCNEIVFITSTIQKPKRKMYPDITNKFLNVNTRQNINLVVFFC